MKCITLQVKHSIRDMSRGQYQILYYPELATAHKVDIKYNGLTVADSPIVLHAKNPGFYDHYHNTHFMPSLAWNCKFN